MNELLTSLRALVARFSIEFLKALGGEHILDKVLAAHLVFICVVLGSPVSGFLYGAFLCFGLRHLAVLVMEGLFWYSGLTFESMARWGFASKDEMAPAELLYEQIRLKPAWVWKPFATELPLLVAVACSQSVDLLIFGLCTCVLRAWAGRLADRQLLDYLSPPGR